MRDDQVRRVMQGLGSRNGILVVDETGFLKKGDKSAGVGRQYSGTAGRIENCQIGVFLGWKTKKGQTFVDRELYLPKDWCEDRQRCVEAGIPKSVTFKTKAELARQMIERVLRLGLRPSWITADEIYGHDGKFRFWLEEIGQPYVLAVPSNQYVTRGFSQYKVADLVRELSEDSWVKINAGTGTKGPRLYNWAVLRINHPHGKEWSRAVLFRRSLNDPKDIAFYLVFCSSKVRPNEIVRVAGSRWSIEECFESGKGEVGLDQYEVRSYHGWYRHMTLAMTAHALLSICRARIFPKRKRKNSLNSLEEFKKKRALSSGSVSKKSVGS